MKKIRPDFERVHLWFPRTEKNNFVTLAKIDLLRLELLYQQLQLRAQQTLSF